MRTICSAAALAACLTVPAVTRAQAAPDCPVAFAGCDDVFGAFCVAGFGTLRYDNLGGGSARAVLLGTLTSYVSGTVAVPASATIEPAGGTLYLGRPGQSSFEFSGADVPLPGFAFGASRTVDIFPEFGLASGIPPYGDGSHRFTDATFAYGLLSYGYRAASDDAMPSGYLHIRLTSTPEPATLALTFGGLAVVGGMAMRRRSKV